jgi:hypothetical protein
MYSLYNHGADDYIYRKNPVKRAEFEPTGHFRYKSDIWWQFFTDRPINDRLYVYDGVAGKDVTEHAYSEFWRQAYLSAIPRTRTVRMRGLC